MKRRDQLDPYLEKRSPMSLLMGGSPALNNEIEERRWPTNGNKDRLDPYLNKREANKRRASIYSLSAVSNEVPPMIFMRGRNSTVERWG